MESYKIDRSCEDDIDDPLISVELGDGYKAKFFVVGMGDDDYITQANILRDRDIASGKWFIASKETPLCQCNGVMRTGACKHIGESRRCLAPSAIEWCIYVDDGCDN